MALAVSEPWVRWGWVAGHQDRILQAVLQHVELTVVAVVLGLVVAAPLGLAAWRWRRSRETVLGIAGILYTIPSLALFALLVPFTGLSVVTAEIGLISYTLLILMRNLVVGLEGVPAEVREAATAMGMRPFRRLLSVELPLALPVLMAGVRVATVTTIGLVTVTALLGEGGLGQLILDGLIRDFPTPLVIGAAGSVLLAIVADVGLAGVQRAVSPWTTP